MKSVIRFCCVLLAITFSMQAVAEENLINKTVFEHLKQDIKKEIKGNSKVNLFLDCSNDSYSKSLDKIIEAVLLDYGVAEETASTFSLFTVKDIQSNCAIDEGDPRRYKVDKMLDVALYKINHQMAVQDPLWNGQGFTLEPSSRTDYDIGYEFNTINSIFKSGSPRIGLQLYRQVNENIHLATSFGLVSAAEETTVNQDIYSLNSLGSSKVLEVSVAPIWMMSLGKVNLSNHYFDSKVGLILKASASMSDINNKVSAKYYAGVRTALGPRFYTDFLFGKTEGLQSTRMELKGEMPFYQKDDGNTFYLGYSLNIGIGNKQDNEADVFKTYITWEVSDAYKMLLGE